MKLERILILAALIGLIGFSTACSTVGEVRDRVIDEVDDRVDRGIDDAVRSGVDRTEESVRTVIRCVVGDTECIEEAQQEGNTVVLTDEEGEVLEDEEGEPVTASAGTDGEAAAGEVSSGNRPGEGVWANYDFVPGTEVLFYEDFTDGRVGDFPRRLEFVSGNMEAVEWEGGRALRATSGAAFNIPLSQQLPERFTLEFEMHTAHGAVSANVGFKGSERERFTYYPHVYLRASERGTGLRNGRESDGGEATMPTPDTFTREFTPVRVMVDGSYVKVYVNEQRVANIPNADIEPGSTLRFFLGSGIHTPSEENPLYLRNIRLAAGGRQMMYDQIQAEGKVVTRGILFDSGSATLRPESTPTLQDLAQMLEQHPDLRLRIEGHTDDTGSAEANRQLSQQRAEAVKQFLVQQHGIAAHRLEAVGKGQDEPAADNSTPEGRQENRRVELVRL